jgi:integrase
VPVEARPRAARIVLHGRATWTVVDGRGLPIDAVDSYLHWLRATDKSPNTVMSYARHLALLFRWLDAYRLDWDVVTFEQLCDFMLAARGGAPPLATTGQQSGRQRATMGAIAAAVREFYEHHRIEGRGPKDLRLSRQQANSRRTTHHFLAHVESRRPVDTNRLAPRGAGSPARVQIIRFEEDFERLLAAVSTMRDALLLSVLYDCGLRIGQALGLRHGDLDPMRRRLRVQRRVDNVNGSLSKQRRLFTVEAPARTFELYRRYLLEELEPAGVDSDYLFVNLRPGRDFGRPCSDGNAAQTIARIGAKAGITGLHPHMLRHTHGTALAKAGWTTAEIAARLGQSFASSADVYIHLASEDLAMKLAATSHLIWKPTAPTGSAQ